MVALTYRAIVLICGVLFNVTTSYALLDFLPQWFPFGSSDGESNHPKVLLGVPDTVAYVGKLFTHSIPDHAFQGDVHHISVHVSGSAGLPDWLYLNTTSNTLRGIPDVAHTGTFIIQVDAYSKSSQSATTSFMLQVRSANQNQGTVQARPLGSRDIICDWDEQTIRTTLILDTDVTSLSAQQRVDLLQTWANYLSISNRAITLNARKAAKFASINDGKILVAGPGDASIDTKHKGIELTWTIACGDFSSQDDITHILEHNINNGNIQSVLGYPIIGWLVTEVLPIGGVDTIRRRRQVRNFLATPIPTATVITVAPTKLPVDVSSSIQPTITVTTSATISPSASTSMVFTSTLTTPVFISTSQGQTTENPSVTSQSTPPLMTSQMPTAINTQPITGIESTSDTDDVSTSVPVGITTPDESGTSLSTQATQFSESTTEALDLNISTTSSNTESQTNIAANSTATESTTRIYINDTLSTLNNTYSTTEMAMAESTTEMPKITTTVIDQDSTISSNTSNLHSSTSSQGLSTVMSHKTSKRDVISNTTEQSNFTSNTPPVDQTSQGTTPSFQFSTVNDSFTMTTSTLHDNSRASVVMSTPNSSSESTASQYVTTVNPGATTQNLTFTNLVTSQTSTAIPVNTTGAEMTTRSSTGGSLSSQASTTIEMSSQNMTSKAHQGSTWDMTTSNNSINNTPFVTSQMSTNSALVTTPSMTSQTPSPAALTSQTERVNSSSMVTSKVSTMTPAITSAPAVTSVVTTNAPTTESINQPPMVLNNISRIVTFLGTYFEYLVPEDTFYDKEDGNTRTLDLELYTHNMQQVTEGYWVQLDVATQTIFGVAVQSVPHDLNNTLFLDHVILLANDSGGLNATTDVELSIDVTSVINVSHQFIVNFELEFSELESNTRQVARISQLFSSYFNDTSQHSYVTITEIRNVNNTGVLFAWSNNTITKAYCMNTTILTLFSIMTPNNSLEQLQSHFGEEFIIASIELEWLNACSEEGYVPPPVIKGESKKDKNGGLPLWLVLFIVFLMLILILTLVIVFIWCLCYRRGDSGRYIPQDEKPIFSNNRKPVIMADEYELQDSPVRKPRKPMVLQADLDSPYSFSNPAYSGPSEPRRKPPSYESSDSEDDRVSSGDSRVEPNAREPVALRAEAFFPVAYAQAPRRPPPAYRLPPPYIERAGTSDI